MNKSNNTSMKSNSLIIQSNEQPLIIMKASNYLEQIRIKIKNNMTQNLKIYLAIAIPILLVLIYFAFKYNFNARALNVISNMNYKKDIQLEQLPVCSDLDKSMQYKLCDYYISSSFMTPCIGNQHYDYVSKEMILEIIQSGARYIQLPICESDVGLNAIPVVGTTQYGQRVITSLNTLDIHSVLSSIRANAFNISNSKINYPLIIHLILNTNNSYTLNVLADTIKETLSDKLCKVSNYQTFPIFLEKLCNLLGQIILIATPEYQGTKLEQYIVPIKLYESYHYSELASMSNPPDTAFTNTYNNKLSMTQQIRSNNIFKTKYPSLDYIVNNSSSIGKTILADKELLNNLTNFNKVGITLIKPQYTTDTISSNYDPAEAFFNGCQLVSMNFQINDDNMKNYLKIFKNSSFVAKPASMRFSEKEESIPDLLQVYKAISPSDSKVINLYNQYNNLLIALEPYAASGLYLTQIEGNLRFTIGSVMTRDKNGNKNYKIGLNQCFLINKSTVSTGTADIPMFLQSPSYDNQLITQNGSYFDLQPAKKIKADLYKQSYVFEKSQIMDSDDDQFFLLRTIDKQTPMYLAYENKMTKAYANSGLVEAQNNMSFTIHIVPFKIVLKIFTLYDGSVKTMDSSNIVGVLENNMKDATGYILEPAFPNNGNNFNYLKDQFYMKNQKTNTYLVYDNDTKFIYDKAGRPSSNGIFNLKSINGFYSLYNSSQQVMVLFQNNLLKFANPNTGIDTNTGIDANANLFKISISYIL